MVSVASGGTADRIAARILFKVLRAGSGTPARYSSTFFGAPLPFAAELRLPDFTFFIPRAAPVLLEKTLPVLNCSSREFDHAVGSRCSVVRSDRETYVNFREDFPCFRVACGGLGVPEPGALALVREHQVLAAV